MCLCWTCIVFFLHFLLILWLPWFCQDALHPFPHSLNLPFVELWFTVRYVLSNPFSALSAMVLTYLNLLSHSLVLLHIKKNHSYAKTYKTLAKCAGGKVNLLKSQPKDKKCNCCPMPLPLSRPSYKSQSIPNSS